MNNLLKQTLRCQSALLIGFFLSPFLILLSNLKEFKLPDADELLWALQNSIVQSTLSLLICFALGFILIEGIFFLRRKIRSQLLLSIFEFLVLLPSFLPALFTLLIFLSILNPFPFGILGISLVHGITYAGLFASMSVAILNEKAKGLFEVSYILGVGRVQMYWQSLKMLKQDFFSLSILIFTICFTSFSIPIAIGGGRGTTLEILIYEKMRQSGNWSQALILSFAQSLLIAFASSLFIRKTSVQMNQRSGLGFLGSPIAILALFAYVFFFMGGFLYYSLGGWQQVFAMPNLWNDVVQVLPATFAIGIAAGAFTFLFFVLSTTSLCQNTLHRFLISFVAPSVSLLGLSVILLSPSFRVIEIIYFLLSAVILFFGGLYKMGFEQNLMKLRQQVEVAKLLGANTIAIFKDIIFPQVLPTALTLSGIAGLWVVGDFALCKVIFTHRFLLSQLIQDLMASYQIEAATSLMSLLIFIGLIVYLLFAGAAHVIRQKST